MFNFEKLDVWKKALSLTSNVYTVTRNFPSDECFGLTNQMRRASVSISSNIAEGSSRHSKVEFARFVEIASGSIYEIVSQSFIAKAQGFVSEPDFEMLYANCEELSKMLSGLRTFLIAGRA
jgi:four helix bundle protein